ncbi:uncharacterized protein METZ01_LOCUS325076, partial [marine metagenome]
MQPGGRVLHYRIVRQLGSGGMGVVFEAVDEGLERQVALKVIQPDQAFGTDEDGQVRESFRREARLAATLHDPGIVTIFSLGHVED